MPKGQHVVGIALGTREEGDLRKAQYKRAAVNFGYKKLSTYIRDVLEKESGFRYAGKKRKSK